MKNIYIYETHTIYGGDGEVTLVNDEYSVVFNADTLFNDLGSIIYFVLKERKQMEQYHLEQIKKQLEDYEKAAINTTIKNCKH